MSDHDPTKDVFVGPGLVMPDPPTVDEAIERLPRVKELKAENERLRAKLKEKAAEFVRMETAWRKECDELRYGKR